MNEITFSKELVAGLVLGVITSMIGSMLVIGIQLANRRRKESAAPFTGLWDATIYNEDGTVAKRDKVSARQKGDHLQGYIVRQEPTTPQHQGKKWCFKAMIRGQVIFGMFWSLDQRVVSFGTFTLRYVGDNEYHGFYMRHQTREASVGCFEDKIHIIRYDWERSQTKSGGRSKLGWPFSKPTTNVEL